MESKKVSALLYVLDAWAKNPTIGEWTNTHLTSVPKDLTIFKMSKPLVIESNLSDGDEEEVQETKLQETKKEELINNESSTGEKRRVVKSSDDDDDLICSNIKKRRKTNKAQADFEATKWNLDFACFRSAFSFKGETIRRICYYTKLPTEVDANIERVITDLERIERFKNRKTETSIAFATPSLKAFMQIWVEVQLKDSGYQMRPLTDLRDANLDKQALFDFTMIKFIVWDVWGKQRASLEALTKKHLPLVTKWYARCIARDELCNLKFPWGIDMYGSLHVPQEDLYNFRDAVYKKTTAIVIPKTYVQRELPKKTFTVEFEKAKAVWSRLVPPELKTLYTIKAKENFQNMVKTPITRIMRDRGELWDSQTVRTTDMNAHTIFFFDFPERKIALRSDWILAFRIHAMYTYAPGNTNDDSEEIFIMWFCGNAEEYQCCTSKRRHIIVDRETEFFSSSCTNKTQSCDKRLIALVTTGSCTLNAVPGDQDFVSVRFELVE